MTGPGPAVRTVSFEKAQLMAAWLMVLNSVDAADARLFAIVAVPTFSVHGCISCDLCVARGMPARRMRVTQIVEHLRDVPGAHRFALDEDTLQVTG